MEDYTKYKIEKAIPLPINSRKALIANMEIGDSIIIQLHEYSPFHAAARSIGFKVTIHKIADREGYARLWRKE